MTKVHIVTQSATREEIADMLQEFETLIKLAVDVRRKVLPGAESCMRTAKRRCSITGVTKMISGGRTGYQQTKRCGSSRLSISVLGRTIEAFFWKTKL